MEDGLPLIHLAARGQKQKVQNKIMKKKDIIWYSDMSCELSLCDSVLREAENTKLFLYKQFLIYYQYVI